MKHEEKQNGILKEIKEEENIYLEVDGYKSNKIKELLKKAREHREEVLKEKKEISDYLKEHFGEVLNKEYLEKRDLDIKLRDVLDSYSNLL